MKFFVFLLQSCPCVPAEFYISVSKFDKVIGFRTQQPREFNTFRNFSCYDDKRASGRWDANFARIWFRNKMENFGT